MCVMPSAAGLQSVCARFCAVLYAFVALQLDKSLLLKMSATITVPDMVIIANEEMIYVVQISLNQPSCFPYAEVAVAVAQTHPGFAELMIARLHEVGLHAVSNTSHSVCSARPYSSTPVVELRSAII